MKYLPGLSVVLLSLAASAWIGSSCGDDTTGQKRVSFATNVVADDGIDAPITNAFGWTITLDKAALSVGPIYFFDGEPVIAALDPMKELSRLLGIRVAHAHPGHYVPGEAMAQMLQATIIDLTENPVALPPTEGVTGFYRSGRAKFEAVPQGGSNPLLWGHVLLLEGEAKKDAMSRLFRLEADTNDVLDADGVPQLEGCVFEGEPNIQENGTITVHVLPSVWLDQAEFDAVPESTDGKPVLLPRDGLAFRAISRGLKKAASLKFSYSTP